MAFPPTWLEMYGNAHATIPADQLTSSWAPQPHLLKILNTTAENYELEAALDSLAVQYAHLFHNPLANNAGTSPQGKGEK